MPDPASSSKAPGRSSLGLTRPGWPTFLLSLLLGGLGIALRVGYLEPLAPLAFGALAAGYLLLVLGVLFPRM